MSIIIFIIILSTLIIVHEFGHFWVARFFNIRVDEFGLGFPPRAKRLFVWKGTPFTLNWLPFGGFVKIFGENPEAPTEMSEPTVPSDSFQSKNRGIQAAVLVAGVAGNFVFAWLLLSLGFMTGLPAPVGSDFVLENARTVITTVLPSSPAGVSGLKSGDAIVSLSREGGDIFPAGLEKTVSPDGASEFIALSLEPITFEIDRGGERLTKVVVPEDGIIAGRPAVGISMDLIGIVKLPPHQALWHGLRTTFELTLSTGQAITSFIFQAVTGRADLSGITGPVGIVGLVGDVRALGFAYILTFAALISINLFIVNLLPIPALDGGRLLFVIIEAVTRKRVSPLVFNAANTVGFALLILLMVVITIHDVRNLF